MSQNLLKLVFFNDHVLMYYKFHKVDYKCNKRRKTSQKFRTITRIQSAPDAQRNQDKF